MTEKEYKEHAAVLTRARELMEGLEITRACLKHIETEDFSLMNIECRSTEGRSIHVSWGPRDGYIASSEVWKGMSGPLEEFLKKRIANLEAELAKL